MSKPSDGMPTTPWPGETDDNRISAVTRRSVLAGAAAAALTIGAEAPAGAQPAAEDESVFVDLSAALTGIAKARLAPGADPIDVKKIYFRRASDPSHATAFAGLLQLTRAAQLQIPDGTNGVIPQDKVDVLADWIEAREDTKFLARSIVLMWYLGAWYEPHDLKKLTEDPGAFVQHTIISPKAYTQGWLWRVAQAHPMGYSDMQFGYWTRPPAARDEFIAVVKKGT